jgi:hypothetical protein
LQGYHDTDLTVFSSLLFIIHVLTRNVLTLDGVLGLSLEDFSTVVNLVEGPLEVLNIFFAPLEVAF